MQRYFLGKLGQSVILLFGVVLLVFAMVRITGDPAALMMPREASAAEIEAFREAMRFQPPHAGPVRGLCETGGRRRFWRLPALQDAGHAAGAGAACRPP